MHISDEYRELNRQLHNSNPSYGANGHRYAGFVLQELQTLQASTVLDFGCGKGTMGRVLRANGVNVSEYDPAIPGKDSSPDPADLVYCGDVAEHVEPEFLDAFLQELRRVTKQELVLVVATVPAHKMLADGRNAHLIVEPMLWWLQRLDPYFIPRTIVAGPNDFLFTGYPK